MDFKNITNMYEILFSVLMGTGMYIAFALIIVRKGTNTGSSKEYKRFAKKKKIEAEDVFADTGLKLDREQYDIIRYILGFAYGAYIFYTWLKGSDITGLVIFFGIMTFMTAPYITIFGHKSPFSYFVEILKREYRSKLDQELFRSMSQLKNIAVAQKHSPISGDYIVEQIARYTNLTKPAFYEMLSLWRVGRLEDAKLAFDRKIGTRLASDFSNMLIKLDLINPSEMVENIVSYQIGIKEERLTRKTTRQQFMSNLMYFPFVSTSFIIILNFVVITIVIDGIRALNSF